MLIAETSTGDDDDDDDYDVLTLFIVHSLKSSPWPKKKHAKNVSTEGNKHKMLRASQHQYARERYQRAMDH